MKSENNKTSAARVTKLLSLNRTQCAVVTSFLYCEGEMSSQEICGDLGLSKSSVSTALQTLIRGEIVRSIKGKPERYGRRNDLHLSQALKLLDSLSGGGRTDEPKQKLTLAISKNVIKRAKDIGINISAITEEFLKAVTCENFSQVRHDIHKAYLGLFEAIKPMVDFHNLEVEVGKTASTDDSGQPTFDPLFLSCKVNLPGLWTTMWKNHETIWTVSDVGSELDNLYSTRVVLENLIEALSKVSQKDKLKLQHLETSLKLAKAILSDDD